MADEPLVVAVTPKTLGNMTEAERHDFNVAFVRTLREQIPADLVPLRLDTDEDPVDQLDDDEIRELYEALADDYIDIAKNVLLPPDPTPEAELRARYARFAEERIAARIPKTKGWMDVEEHDEIGPVLVRKGQKFSGPRSSR